MRTRLAILFSLFLLVGTSGLISSRASAGEVPYGFGVQSTAFAYGSSGTYHDPESLHDFGLMLDFSYPVISKLRIKAIGIIGPITGFEFVGIGGGVDFAPSAVLHQEEGDSVDIVSFRKWRPYVDAFLGYNSARTHIDVGTINRDVSEDLYGIVVRGGAGYAISPAWEVQGGLWGVYSTSSDVVVSGFGLSFGLKLNMF